MRSSRRPLTNDRDAMRSSGGTPLTQTSLWLSCCGPFLILSSLSVRKFSLSPTQLALFLPTLLSQNKSFLTSLSPKHFLCPPDKFLFLNPSRSFLSHPTHITMAALRMTVPKMGSLMASSASKVARPVVRSNIKLNGAQRSFSGTCH